LSFDSVFREDYSAAICTQEVINEGPRIVSIHQYLPHGSQTGQKYSFRLKWALLGSMPQLAVAISPRIVW
jgi:hypothetical protein